MKYLDVKRRKSMFVEPCQGKRRTVTKHCRQGIPTYSREMASGIYPAFSGVIRVFPVVPWPM